LSKIHIYQSECAMLFDTPKMGQIERHAFDDLALAGLR
jgi:hypothetical protein